MSDHVTITGRKPTQKEAAAVLAQLFAEPGEYVIAKATAPAAPIENFDEWFLEQLSAVMRNRFVNAQLATWETLERMLRDRGVSAPSELSFWQLNQALWDMGTANTASMVGIHVPADVAARLHAIGFTVPEILSFPSLAYRMGKIYETLQAGPVVAWDDLLRQARSFPLSSAERAAVGFAEQRAGTWLKPIFDASGRVWTAEREIAPLRERVATAIAQRRSAREVARELSASQRAQGILRDADRVLRSEIGEARNRGAWDNDSKRWIGDALLFRQTSSGACRDCLRLLKSPDGMPRRYPRSEVERQDALGPNRGPRQDWHLRIGIIHVNCACAPWMAWHDAMASIVGTRAPEYAQLMRELRVFGEAEAA